jgi:hypothetical protein
MNLTKKEMGEMLKWEILNNFSVKKIANLAYEIFINSRGNLSPEARDILQSIFLMEAGPEFEFSKEELIELANKLIEMKNDNEQ